MLPREALETMLAEGCSLEEIGRRIDRHPSTVSYWMRRHGLTPNGASVHAARGGISRETLEPLIAENLSVRDIAIRLDRSYTTVRYWMKRHGLKARPWVATEATLVTECPVHGATAHATRSDGYARCLRCRSESVTRSRQQKKIRLVQEFGGCCAGCGYDRCVRALHFHHRDPTAKRFGLSNRGLVMSMDVLREEARKCVLLCANCHMEVEAGLRPLPD
jgi:transposase-like protein